MTTTPALRWTDWPSESRANCGAIEFSADLTVNGRWMALSITRDGVSYIGPATGFATCAGAKRACEQEAHRLGLTK